MLNIPATGSFQVGWPGATQAHVISGVWDEASPRAENLRAACFRFHQDLIAAVSSFLWIFWKGEQRLPEKLLVALCAELGFHCLG